MITQQQYNTRRVIKFGMFGCIAGTAISMIFNRRFMIPLLILMVILMALLLVLNFTLFSEVFLFKDYWNAMEKIYGENMRCLNK